MSGKQTETQEYARPITKERRACIDDFIRRLTLMKREACILGLYQTMHAIDGATTKVGWELAEILNGKQDGCR